MSESSFHHLRASRRQWWLVVVTGALTLFCGSVGVWQYEHAHPTHELSPLSLLFGSLYHALQMLVLHTPHFEEGTNLWIESGRWFGAFTLVATTGLLLWKRLSHEFRLIRLAAWTNHHVVCGLGQKGLEIVRCLKEFNHETKTFNQDVRVVVIDPKPDEHFADECAALGVCVIAEDATESGVLGRARVTHAREIIVLTPEDETNVRIATQIRELVDVNRFTRPECFVHLANIHLRERLQQLASNDTDKRSGCALHFFDVFDNEARRVLLELPLDGTGISKDDPCSVHMVILGFGRMGRSLALRAAKMGHFANGKKLRISVVDRHAERSREHFLFRYPILEKDKVCHLTFHQAEAQSFTARRLIEGWAAEPDTLLHIFVCLDDNSRTVEVGLRLQEALINRPDCTLNIRIKSHSSLAGILERSPVAGPRITVFGMLEDACCDRAFRNEYNESIARFGHDEFIKHRLADSRRTPENDPALRPWNELTEDLRESSRQQADHIAIKLRAISCEMAQTADVREAITKFKTADIELLAELEHTRWNAERWLAGWRYGPPGKKAERISPHIGPWSDLDDSIKKYDHDAITEIPERLAMSNLPQKVVRKPCP